MAYVFVVRLRRRKLLSSELRDTRIRYVAGLTELHRLHRDHAWQIFFGDEREGVQSTSFTYTTPLLQSICACLGFLSHDASSITQRCHCGMTPARFATMRQQTRRLEKSKWLRSRIRISGRTSLARLQLQCLWRNRKGQTARAMQAFSFDFPKENLPRPPQVFIPPEGRYPQTEAQKGSSAPPDTRSGQRIAVP
jgi:hypothetical protein